MTVTTLVEAARRSSVVSKVSGGLRVVPVDQLQGIVVSDRLIDVQRHAPDEALLELLLEQREHPQERVVGRRERLREVRVRLQPVLVGEERLLGELRVHAGTVRAPDRATDEEHDDDRDGRDL